MTANIQLPQYLSHKKVWALKIKDLKPTGDGGLVMTPEEESYEPIILFADYVSKHNPVVGGYYVVYADGYSSWSPAEAFEQGYTRIG